MRRFVALAKMAATSTPPVLTYWERNPPFAVLAAAKFSRAPLDVKPDPKGTKDNPVELTLSTGDKFTGLPLIVRYIARTSTTETNLYGDDPISSTQVDFWVDYLCNTVVVGSGLEGALNAISDYLALRSFLIGHKISLADVTLWGQLLGNPMWKKYKASPKCIHLSRWFDFVADQPECKTAAEEMLAMDSKRRAIAAAASAASEGKKTADAGGSFDIALPNAEEGKVVTRFPPEPSGFLHVGHAKAALLNQYFADMYKGKLIVRFDDTNPSKEKDEYVENIVKDIKDLGLKFDRISYTSDYFPQMMELAERLIKSGVLYADDTPVDQMREERLAKKNSKRRDRSVQENLAIWEEMKKGTEVGVANALRFKMNMESVNGCLRDPVAFRCNPVHHWRTGDRFKVYPTYDCACPFVDAFEGVTHALRTSEYKDREEQYYWVLREMQKVWPGLPSVHMWDYSRLNFVYTVLSKRKLQWFVDTGRVDGWYDPRMPTVQGLIRRGLRMEALQEFILSQGASRNVTYQEWDKIWTINKKIIDPVCGRHTAVLQSPAPVAVNLLNGPAPPEQATVPRHKKYEPAGTKVVVRTSQIYLDEADAKELQEGEEFTLMDWGNAFVRGVSRDEATGLPRSLDVELNIGGDPKRTKWKLTWLPQSPELTPLALVDLDFLITKRKVEEEDDFQQLVNDNTRSEVAALGDVNMRELPKGEIIQLERKGYYIVDQPYGGPGKPAVLLSIPDGRTKNMVKS